MKKTTITKKDDRPVTMWQLEKVMDNFALSLKKNFDEIDQRFDKIDRRFHEIDRRFHKIDLKLAGMDNRIGGINGRLDWMAENYVRKDAIAS